jgi:arylsulfatase A-like enzyme
MIKQKSKIYLKMKILKKILLIPIVLIGISVHAQIENPKPNVIFILTDDQGYADLACHGNLWIKTPHLDKLHSESVRFTNFHVGTTCAPSRAGLMTGKYCNKVGVWHTINGREILDPEVMTLAESMKKAGYHTGIFGKWHLGDNYPFRPQDRGFEEVLINGGGGVGQQPDYWNNDYFDDTYFHNGKPKKYKGYCTDVWFSEAIKFIRKNKNQPFFCYISTNAPHSPYHVEEKYSDLYRENSNIPNPNFYGMITNIDENVGKLRNELKKMRIFDNTIFVFMTDNGTSAGVKFSTEGEVVSGYNANMRGIKGSPYDGGHRVPFFIHWPHGGINKARDISNITSYIDFMPTILDLCGVETSIKSFDGVSLKQLITGGDIQWPERVIFTDTQREEFLIKWKQFAAMTDRWRLVEKNELYDIETDPGQRNNVAEEYPEVINKLQTAYENWWQDVAVNADKYNCIKIGTPHENPVRLNSHDIHTEEGMPAWSQEMVRADRGSNGFWAIEIVTPGIYEFELCRWPKESNLKINESAPLGKIIPGGKSYSSGKKLSIKKARIKIENIEQIKELKSNAKSIKFYIKLNAGKTFLYTWMIDDKETERAAYYVYAKRK